MKKVLIISYYWPPSGGSGVQRWLKFAKYLPSCNWEPIIYTPLNPEPNTTDENLLKDISPDLEVIKTKIWEPYGIYKSLFGRGKKEIKANIIGSENKSIKHKISLFIRGNFFIPDPRSFWVRPSVKYLTKYLKENPVDIIVSTGPPHSMHLIAKGVAKNTGIKWVADFRDPWTEIFYFKHLNLSNYAFKKHRKLEQSVLDNADTVVVVSNQMKKDFEKRTKTPVEIITNGFDPADFEQAKREITPIKDKFIISHTGIFVDNGNPDNLWRALSEKSKEDQEFKQHLEIRLMGQVDGSILKDIEECNLSANTINMGYVSHKTAVEWQLKSNLLLLPLRKEPEAAAILTGKFFEYLAAGNPILAFGPTNGDLAKALKETESGVIVDFEDYEGTKKALDLLYTNYKNNIIQQYNPKSDIYSRKGLTIKLTEIFSKILNNN